ncbi:hypothetical protein D3C87_998310 [compost metagenome]
MLDGCSVEFVADGFINGDARGALVAEYTDLDQIVSRQAPVDLGQDRAGQAFRADHDHGVQTVGAGAEGGALGRYQF